MMSQFCKDISLSYLSEKHSLVGYPSAGYLAAEWPAEWPAGLLVRCLGQEICRWCLRCINFFQAALQESRETDVHMPSNLSHLTGTKYRKRRVQSSPYPWKSPMALLELACGKWVHKLMV